MGGTELGIWTIKISVMKSFLAFSVLFHMLVGSFTITQPTTHSTEVVGVAHENIFTLKASKKFKGATVEVVATNGYIISSQRLSHRKLIIDFKKIAPGTYKINVKKGSANQEFTFIKQ